MNTRPLTNDDRAALTALLMHAPGHNVFHLSALEEYGLTPYNEPGSAMGLWAVGVFRGDTPDTLAGALMSLRGTGGLCHSPGDGEVLAALAEALQNAAFSGKLGLLSGHASQLDPLLPLAGSVVNEHYDRCHFCTLEPGDLALPTVPAGISRQPRLATGGDGDMERLIDFYFKGFYSLAKLPSRAAWRSRLSEQVAFRTLFLIEDEAGRVISSALSSAEGGRAAMLGGVATLDEYRGKGLSTRCVGALCNHLFAKGANTTSLFYLKDNIQAARVYEKLGFQPAGEWLLVPVGLGMLFGAL